MIEAESAPSDQFGTQLESWRERMERALEARLPQSKLVPARLHEAMRYSVLGGGKRIRPALLFATARAVGLTEDQVEAAACAIELVHVYSLVHDDLPAMDNDDVRRGRPTAHKAFDEATAILAGDGLLTFAFDILSRPQTHEDPAVRVELVTALARASGVGGMAGGQMLDLAAEGRFVQKRATQFTENEVLTLQAMKTGALLRFGCEAGGILAAAAPARRQALSRYGAAVGKAFQIADDLLDLEGDSTLVGKAIGKDAAAGKATMVSVLGVDAAKVRLQQLVAEAEQALAPFGSGATILIEAAKFVAERRA